MILPKKLMPSKLNIFFPFVTVSAMNLFFLVAVYYIPESPNHLMSRGREKEAEKVLNLLDIGQAHNIFSQFSQYIPISIFSQILTLIF